MHVQCKQSLNVTVHYLYANMAHRELRQLFAHIQQTVMKKHSSEHKNASEPLPNVYYTCVR
jgi:hypothetical protein